MRVALAILLVSSLAVHAAESLPSVPKGTDYGKARTSLISKGWAPVTMPDAQSCDGDPRCKGRPEMEACAGTGLGQCLFTWRKGKTLIEITTVGETKPTVSSIACKEGC